MAQGVLPEPVERALGKDFVNRIDFFSRTILEEEGDIRVITHDDADGICAGGIMGTSLHRSGKSFHLTSVKGLNDKVIEELDEEENEITIVLDMGSSHMDRFEKSAGRALIIDHHTISSKEGKSSATGRPTY